MMDGHLRDIFDLNKLVNLRSVVIIEVVLKLIDVVIVVLRLSISKLKKVLFVLVCELLQFSGQLVFASHLRLLVIRLLLFNRVAPWQIAGLGRDRLG